MIQPPLFSSVSVLALSLFLCISDSLWASQLITKEDLVTSAAAAATPSHVHVHTGSDEDARLDGKAREEVLANAAGERLARVLTALAGAEASGKAREEVLAKKELQQEKDWHELGQRLQARKLLKKNHGNLLSTKEVKQ